MIPLLRGLSLFFLGLIGYTYVGYPALAWVIARRRSVAESDPTYLPTVSLIIAAFNEETAIRQKIEGALELDYPDHLLQIIVVTDGSTDETANIVAEFGAKGVVLLHDDERRGKAKAIDRAIPFASGEILVFTDANNVFELQAIRELVAPFADPRVGLVSGAKHVLDGVPGLDASEAAYWRYEAFIKEQESRLGHCLSVSGEVLALRNGIVGPLEEGVILDDFARLLQVIDAGYQTRFASRAISLESTMADMESETHRRARNTAGRWRLVFGVLSDRPRLPIVVWWQFFSHKVLRLVLPLAMISLVVSSLGEFVGRRLKLRPGRFASLLVSGQVVFYALAALGRLVPLRGRLRVLFIPRYLVETNWASARGLRRALRENEIQMWDRVARHGDGGGGTAVAHDKV